MSVLEQHVDSNVGLQEQLIRRSWEDEQFAELLRTNPRVAIAEATGIELPGDMEIHVHEESADTLHLVVPAKPGDTSPGEIKAWGDGFPTMVQTDLLSQCEGCSPEIGKTR